MTCFPSAAQERNRSIVCRANQRIETVQRLVQHQQVGIVRDGLRQPHPLPHALGIRRDLAVRRLGQTGGRSSAFHAFPPLPIARIRKEAARW